MRRSSLIKLTLVPVLASARLVHADPVPSADDPNIAPPSAQVWVAPQQDPCAKPIRDENGNIIGYEPRDPYEYVYNGPDGPVCEVMLPPGEATMIPNEVPCDEDPYQVRCERPMYYGGNVWVSRGGFGLSLIHI